jgi:hypothetical protein
MAHLLGHHVLSTLSPSARSTVLGKRFFPRIIQKAFVSGLHPALDVAGVLCVGAAVMSYVRGDKREGLNA